MVIRYRQRDVIISELQSEFAPTEEGLILPTHVVGIGGKSRKPLSQKENLGVVFFKDLVATSTTNGGFFGDVEAP